MFNTLSNYINLINNEEIREDVIKLMNRPEVGEAFKYPSSSTGLFHPADENQPWGLLIHTLRVCNVAIQLYRCVEDYSNNTIAYDILIASALLHDVPYKNIDGKSNKNHAHDNAVWFSQNSTMPMEVRTQIANCIQWHMGRWDSNNHTDYDKFPNNLLSWSLHQSDCIVSRKNISVGIDCIDYIKSNLI